MPMRAKPSQSRTAPHVSSRLPLWSRWVMHALEGSFKVFLEVSKRPLQSRRPRDQHIIMILERPVRCEERDQSAQAPANAISGDGAADRLGHGEAEPRAADGPGGGSSRLRLKHERGRRTARAAPEPQEFRPFLESDQRHGRGLANWVRSSHERPPQRLLAAGCKTEDLLACSSAVR